MHGGQGQSLGYLLDAGPIRPVLLGSWFGLTVPWWCWLAHIQHTAIQGGGGGCLGGFVALMCRGGGGVVNPTCMAQNDTHVALIILTTQMWGGGGGGLLVEKTFSGQNLCSCAFGANIRSYTKQKARHGTPFLQPPPSFGGRPCPPPPPRRAIFRSPEQSIKSLG